jgi:hypothetical protein
MGLPWQCARRGRCSGKQTNGGELRRATGPFIASRFVIRQNDAWLNRCRGLAKDRKGTFLRLASIRLGRRKLCNPA